MAETLNIYTGWLRYENSRGEVAERLNAAVSKTVIRVFPYPGFESLPLRHESKPSTKLP
jgi:hypothetical protein